MSSIIVKGMKMRKSCYGGIGCDCDFIKEIDGNFVCSRTGKSICGCNDHCLPDCPLVEIPIPHGNLIDKEKVISACQREICTSCNDNVAGRCTGGGNCWVLKALNIIAEAPAVIQAE